MSSEILANIDLVAGQLSKTQCGVNFCGQASAVAKPVSNRQGRGDARQRAWRGGGRRAYLFGHGDEFTQKCSRLTKKREKRVMEMVE